MNIGNTTKQHKRVMQRSNLKEQHKGAMQKKKHKTKEQRKRNI
jgi:hypothetical protein